MSLTGSANVSCARSLASDLHPLSLTSSLSLPSLTPPGCKLLAGQRKEHKRPRKQNTWRRASWMALAAQSLQ